MSEVKTLVNTETKEVRTVDLETAKRLAGVKSEKRGGPLWRPKDGKWQVTIQDPGGQTRFKTMDADAVWSARSNPTIEVVGGDKKQIMEIVRQQNVAKGEHAAAAGMGLETFAANAVPGSRAVARAFLPGDLGDDAGRLAQIQDEENRGAAVGGTVAGIVGGMLVPVIPTGRGAMSILGFTDELGNAVASAALRKGIPAGAAKVAGRGTAGALSQVPAHIMFEAAQAVDYDQPLSHETFARDLGTHMLIGAAFEAALPFAGTALKQLRPDRAAVHAANIGIFAKTGVPFGGTLAKKVGQRVLKGQAAAAHSQSHLPSMWEKAGNAMRSLGQNAPRRAAAGRVIDDAVDASRTYAKAIDDALPSSAKTLEATGAVARGIDDIAARSPSVASSQAYHKATENIHHLAGLETGTQKFRTIAQEYVEGVRGNLDSPHLPKGMFKGASKTTSVDADMAVNAIRQEIKNLGGNPDALGMLNKINVNAAPHQVAKDLFSFRNRAVIDAARSGDPTSSAVASIITRNVDDVLTDAAVFGEGATKMVEILKASDDALDSARMVELGIDDILNIDGHASMEGFGVGRSAEAITKGHDAIRVLNDRGVITGAQYLTSRATTAGQKLGNLTPGLEAAAAVNTVRKSAASEFRAVLADPITSTEAIQLSKVESAARYFDETSELIGKYLNKPSAKVSMKTGVFKFREMKTFKEKEEAFYDIQKEIEAVTASEDILIDRTSRVAENLQSDPGLANGVAFHAVRRAAYLKQHLPTVPQGLVPYHGYTFSPAEISNFLEIAGAADDPISVMASALAGQLNESSLKAVADLYPHMLADMRVQISQAIIADQDNYIKFTYRQRMDIDTFLGGGFEPSAQLPNLLSLQDRSAQTSAQDQALRGQGAMRTSQPGDMTSSDRLASF